MASPYLISYLSLHFVSVPTSTIHALLFASKPTISLEVFSIGWLLLPLLIFQHCLQAPASVWSQISCFFFSACINCAWEEAITKVPFPLEKGRYKSRTGGGEIHVNLHPCMLKSGPIYNPIAVL